MNRPALGRLLHSRPIDVDGHAYGRLLMLASQGCGLKWLLTMANSETRIDVIVRFANGGSFVPEDLALIEAIRTSRSILGASRTTGVSYRKCWLMVDAMNRTFETPVFATFPGRKGGGAELTDFGERLVALYRSMERGRGARARKALPSSTLRSIRPIGRGPAARLGKSIGLNRAFPEHDGLDHGPGAKPTLEAEPLDQLGVSPERRGGSRRERM